ncbi:MAG: hypothetical protein IKI04_01690 [Bacilli bacterium]|nr:hypothetical protein [Bacilli bacterium]
MGKKGEYIIDDSFIFDIIDEKLAKIDKNILKEVKNNSDEDNYDYEPYNYEEEELEEDDYYHDDLD